MNAPRSVLTLFRPRRQSPAVMSTRCRRLPCSLLAAMLVCSPTWAFNTYRVGAPIIGQEHNDVLNRWVNREFSVWVGAEGKSEYLVFQATTSLKPATVLVDFKPATREKLRKAVSKAIEWSEVARKNHADATKGLDCFGDDRNGLCAKDGQAYQENQLGMSFFAANGGQQTNLILNVIDRENQFTKAQIYLALPQMTQLLQVIDSIDASMRSARETAKKDALFK